MVFHKYKDWMKNKELTNINDATYQKLIEI